MIRGWGSWFALVFRLVSYCRAYTPTHPLRFCVPHIPPAASGTKMWLLIPSAATLCELLFVVTFCSHCLLLASMTPRTGPVGMSLAAR